MDKPLVSIIVNNYNYGQFLYEAIDSALDQTYLYTEVIVVDDGSTDNSWDVIKSYGQQIISVLKQNGGQASAFNVGFEASKGEIVCFLDADDIFIPEKVTEIVNIFSSYQDIGWCYHPLQLIDTNKQKIVQTSYNWSSGEYDVRAFIQRGKLKDKLPCYPATSGLCFTRSLLQQILPMPEAITITSDNFLKFTAIGLSKGFALAKELTLQRIHDTNAFTLRKDKQQLTARINILTAYWIRKKFPLISKFANNLFAIGIGTYWRHGGVETAFEEIVQIYLSSLLPLEKLEIKFRAFYYYVKL